MHSSHNMSNMSSSTEAGTRGPGLRQISSGQWRAGIAAWLGWMFDGLDMHLYTLVALPFVAELMRSSTADPAVSDRCAWIQAAFLIGWAVGGGLFGRVGDRLGRTRALMMTILVYAAFTGLSFFARSWWHLLVFRFLAALGIGGEWAVGASLLAETWPRRWRPWIAAVLQTSGNLGVILASAAYYLIARGDLPNRWIFLVGVLPALLVFWIRRSVPESGEWNAEHSREQRASLRAAALFGPGLRRTTLLTIVVCALSLTAHWAFLFWFPQHLRGLGAQEGLTTGQIGVMVSEGMMLVIGCSMVGNFAAGAVARKLGFRRAILVMCLAYCGAMTAAYCVPRSTAGLWYFLAAIGACQGLFALFTMYLPPLFPTLLRTTGAGLCYNIGRIAAAFGTVFFGMFSHVGDYRLALLYAGLLFVPASVASYLLPDEPASEQAASLRG